MNYIDLPQALKDARPQSRGPVTLRAIGPTLAAEIALQRAFLAILRDAAQYVNRALLPLAADVREQLAVDAEWDPSKHPRHSRGTERGGQFAKKNDGDVTTVEGAQAFVDDLVEQFPEVGEVKVTLYDNPGMEAIAFAGKNNINLLKANWIPEKLQRFEKEWQGLVVDPTPKGILVHEFGHVAIKQLSEKHGLEKVWDISRKYANIPDERVGISNARSPSPYGSENLSEFQAETFVAFYRQRTESGAFETQSIANAMWKELLSLGKRTKDAEVRDDVVAMNRAFERFRDYLDQRSLMSPTIANILETEEARHRSAFSNAVKAATNFDPSRLLRSPDMRAHIQAAIEQQVSAIRGITDELAKRVTSLIMREAMRGTSQTKLAQLLTEQFKWSYERAKFIARDQLATFNGNLNRVRQIQLGIKQYRWHTKLDERVRKKHEQREGNVYSWIRPPSGGHPGEDYNCRCVARAYIPEPETLRMRRQTL